MPAPGDILRLTSCANLFDQRVCNVFYYTVSVWTGNTSIPDAVTSLFDFLFDGALSALTDELVWDEVVYNNLLQPAEDQFVSLSKAGTDTTFAALSPFDAASIRLFGANALTRSGYKRIAGITEGTVANGGVIESGVATTLQGLADRMASTFDDSGGTDVEFLPVIVGRTPAGQPDLSRVNPVQSASLQPNKTTQNTRKRGRGI